MARIAGQRRQARARVLRIAIARRGPRLAAEGGLVREFHEAAMRICSLSAVAIHLA